MLSGGGQDTKYKHSSWLGNSVPIQPACPESPRPTVHIRHKKNLFQSQLTGNQSASSVQPRPRPVRAPRDSRRRRHDDVFIRRRRRRRPVFRLFRVDDFRSRGADRGESAPGRRPNARRRTANDLRQNRPQSHSHAILSTLALPLLQR